MLETYVIRETIASGETLARLREEISNELRQLETALGVDEADHSSASGQSRVISPADSSKVNTNTSPDVPRSLSSCSQYMDDEPPPRVLNDIIREQQRQRQQANGRMEKQLETQKETGERVPTKEATEERIASNYAETRKPEENRNGPERKTSEEKPDYLEQKNGPETGIPEVKNREKKERRGRLKGKRGENQPPEISMTVASGEAPTLQPPNGFNGERIKMERVESRIENHKDDEQSPSPHNSPSRERVANGIGKAKGKGKGATLALPGLNSSPRRSDWMERSQSHPRDSDRSLPALSAYELHSSVPDLHSPTQVRPVATTSHRTSLANSSQYRQNSVPNPHQNVQTNGFSEPEPPTHELPHSPPHIKQRLQSPMKISVNNKISISSPTKLSCATRVIMVRPSDSDSDPNSNSSQQLQGIRRLSEKESGREMMAAEAVMKLNGMRGSCGQCAQQHLKLSYEEGPEEVPLETVVPRNSVSLVAQGPPSRDEAIVRSLSQESFDSCSAGQHCRTKYCILM